MPKLKKPQVQVYKDDSKRGWRWRVVSKNGRIVADSGESYESKGNAMRAARALIRIAKEAEVVY